MSSSARLRETHFNIGGGRTIFNEEAHQHEKNLQDSVLKIKSELESMYPELKFTYRKKLYLSEVAEKLGKTFTPASKNPYVSPDGGLLFLEWNGTEYPILISEAKKQGTNDERYKEGKNKQGRGNGIERAYKNALTFSQYNEKLDYNPYVIFACGCDFDKDSSIIDRLWHLTRFEPMNTNLSLFNEDVTSVYLKGHHYTEEPNFWNVSEIYEIMKEIATDITNHIIKK
jgi:type II restriction enzyme